MKKKSSQFRKHSAEAKKILGHKLNQFTKNKIVWSIQANDKRVQKQLKSQSPP